MEEEDAEKDIEKEVNINDVTSEEEQEFQEKPDCSSMIKTILQTQAQIVSCQRMILEKLQNIGSAKTKTKKEVITPASLLNK
jgi:hypothetical protein